MNESKVIEIKDYLFDNNVDINNVIIAEDKKKGYIKISIGLEFFQAKDNPNKPLYIDNLISSIINNYFDFFIKTNKVLIIIKEENVFKLFSKEKLKN